VDFRGLPFQRTAQDRENVAASFEGGYFPRIIFFARELNAIFKTITL